MNKINELRKLEETLENEKTQFKESGLKGMDSLGERIGIAAELARKPLELTLFLVCAGLLLATKPGGAEISPAQPAPPVR